MDASLLRCRSQWQICKDTVRFSTASAPVVTLIEKFLQEIEGKDVESIVLDVELIERESCKKIYVL